MTTSCIFIICWPDHNSFPLLCALLCISYQIRSDRKSLEQDRSNLLLASKKAQVKCAELENKVHFLTSTHQQMTNRLHKLEEEDKARSDRVIMMCYFCMFFIIEKICSTGCRVALPHFNRIYPPLCPT